MSKKQDEMRFVDTEGAGVLTEDVAGDAFTDLCSRPDVRVLAVEVVTSAMWRVFYKPVVATPKLELW